MSRELGVDVLEVREKLRILRVHVPASDVRRPEVDALIAQARATAAATCDICGAAGSFRSASGAPRVRCDLHSEYAD